MSAPRVLMSTLTQEKRSKPAFLWLIILGCVGLLNAPAATAASHRHPSLMGILMSGSALSALVLEQPVLQPQDAGAGGGPTTPPDSPTGPTPPTEAQTRDIEFLRPILTNEASDPVSRSEAAARLLAMDLPQAGSILDQALRSGKEPVVISILTALQESPKPPPGLLPPCLELLRGGDPTGAGIDAEAAMLDPLARALVGYGEQALSEITSLAHDSSAPVSNRLRAIRVTSAFRTQAGAAGLIALLDPTRGESQEITCAACRSLQRLSGSPHGCEPELWHRWWSNVGGLSDAEWNEMILGVLTSRIAELERVVSAEQARNEQVLRVLSAVYAQLFPVLDISSQINLLPGMLDHELPAVRRFALERVERIMRDSVPIPPSIQSRLVQRLQNDPLPDVRSRSLRLLDQQNYEGLATLIAGRLNVERDRQVVAVLLEVLTRRPAAEAIAPLTGWLSDGQLGAAAADAVWAFGGLATLPADQAQNLLAALQAVDPSARKPSHARLHALIGAEAEMAGLESMLDADDQRLRQSVAEGFVRRGWAQPLLERAEDPVIRPAALRVLAQGPAELPRFQTLVSLRSAEESDPAWESAVRILVRRLSLSDLLEADAVLAGLNRVPSALRIEGLLPVAENPPEGATAEQRSVLLVRLAPLLMESGRAARAHELLVQLNGVPSSPELLRVKFRAAALSMQWDAAFQLSSEPAAWVSTLTWVVEFDKPAAARLRDEIARRFAEQMADEVRAEFDTACAKLQAQEPPAAVSEEAGAGSQPAEEEEEAEGR